MLSHKRNFKAILLLVMGMSFLTNCSSKQQTLYTTPPTPDKFEKLGWVSGSATGSHGVFLPPQYVIPIGLNSRVERAYKRALMQAPGATSLIDVTYQESWYWWVIGTAMKVTISGEAIREVNNAND